MLVQPGVLESAAPLTPKIPDDGSEIGSAEPFSHFELYLTLGNAIGATPALDAADAVEGGRAVTYERNDNVCLKVAFTPRTKGSGAYLVSVLRQWAATRSNVTVHDAAEPGFSACDPGAKAIVPARSRFQDVAALLQMRTSFTVEAAEGGLDGELARCLGRVLMHDSRVLGVLDAIATGGPTPTQLDAIGLAGARARARCDADLDADLR
jgi:hypothetical protein